MQAQRISVLDGWRGAAILFVLVSHFVPGFGVGQVFNAGRVGVELFFALSGVLIGRILFVEGMGLTEFSIRRFGRIVPSMWVVVLVVAPFVQISAKSFTGDMLGLANLANNPVQLSHLWSVAMELQGYVCLGLMCAVSRRTGCRPAWLIGLALATICALIAVTSLRGRDDYYATYWQFPYRFVAMFSAAALVSSPRLRAACGRLCLAATALGLALQFDVVADGIKYTLGSFLVAVGCVGMTSASLPALVARALGSRFMAAFGAASYSLYLWQQPFMAWGGAPWYLRLALAVALGFMADRLWDRRLNRYATSALRRLVGARKPLAEPPPPAA